MIITLLFLVSGVNTLIKEFEVKDNKIWELEVEVVDLKEQIHNLEKRKIL